ncbi:MAG: hypothetical protein ACREH3_09975 [Geminicoccales bacterium]
MHSSVLALLLAFAATALLAEGARADRAVTPEEQASIAAALEAEGCSGGEVEYDDDDDDFEVEDAQCADGTYDFELTADFQIRERERDD